MFHVNYLLLVSVPVFSLKFEIMMNILLLYVEVKI